MGQGGLYLLGLAFFMCAAWFSHGYINLDEHFQVIEFLGLKLGKVEAETLTWEYFTQSRSWFPAALFYLPAKVQLAFGSDNPVYMVRSFRILAGLLGFSSVILLYLSSRRSLRLPQHRVLLLASLLFICFMPSYHVRTSSENLSGCFIVIATSLIFLRNSAGAAFFFAGAFAAMAFHCRYQVGIMVAGQAFWILFTHRFSVRLGGYLFGLTAGLILGIAVDFWGWGEFHLTAWNYLRIQLLEGKVNTFGVSPWYHYFYLLWDDIPKPFGILLFAVAVIYWARFHRSMLTWMTLPFVIVHFFVGHKEVRFLIPVLYFAPLMMVQFVDAISDTKLAAIKSRGLFRAAAAFLVLVNVGFLLRETFVPKAPGIAFIGAIYERGSEELVWDGENPYIYNPLLMHFYQVPRLVQLDAPNGELPRTNRVIFYQRSRLDELKIDPCGHDFCLSECENITPSPDYYSWAVGLDIKKFAGATVLRQLSSCLWHARQVD